MVKRITISQVVTSVYCEQKAVHDATFGTQRDPNDVSQSMLHIRAEHGTRLHRSFESDGRVLVATGGRTDKRCFVASSLFGYEASETQWLRAWRDRVLKPLRLGRVVANLYYRLSPYLIEWVVQYPRIRIILKSALLLIIRIMGYKP